MLNLLFKSQGIDFLGLAVVAGVRVKPPEYHSRPLGASYRHLQGISCHDFLLKLGSDVVAFLEARKNE
jgi:hypothetical protein